MIYPGQIGIMELVAFYKSAPEAQKSLMRKLMKGKQYEQAWELLQQFLGVRFLPAEA